LYKYGDYRFRTNHCQPPHPSPLASRHLNPHTSFFLLLSFLPLSLSPSLPPSLYPCNRFIIATTTTPGWKMAYVAGPVAGGGGGAGGSPQPTVVPSSRFVPPCPTLFSKKERLYYGDIIVTVLPLPHHLTKILWPHAYQIL